MATRKGITALAFSVLLALSGLTWAADDSPFSGNELLSYCDGDVAHLGFCLGYTLGISQGYIWGHGFAVRTLGQPDPGAMICKPPEVTNGQLKDVVVKYLRANPAERHERADKLVLFALIKAWPCKE